MKPMYKRAYFVCCATYHLSVALYYAMSMDWHGMETILVWQNNTFAEVDMALLEKSFNRVIIMRGKNLVQYPFLEQQRYKIVYAGWLFPMSEIGRLLKEMPSGNVVFIFNDMVRLPDRIAWEFGKNKDNLIVLVDEGTGTYHKTKQTKGLKERIGNALCGQRVEPYIGANPYISVVMARDVEKLPDYQKENRRVVKQNQLFFDKRWTEKMMESFSTIIDRYKRDSSKKLLLWIGEPIPPIPKVNETELTVLDRLFGILHAEYNIVIKMHPREEPDKYCSFQKQYEVDIISEKEIAWLPVELLANIIKPDLVLTPMSSAPIGIDKGIWVVYCNRLFGFDNMSNVIRELMEHRPNTSIIDNIEDLLNEVPRIVETSAQLEDDVRVENEDIRFLQSLMGDEGDNP